MTAETRILPKQMEHIISSEFIFVFFGCGKFSIWTNRGFEPSELQIQIMAWNFHIYLVNKIFDGKWQNFICHKLIFWQIETTQISNSRSLNDLDRLMIHFENENRNQKLTLVQKIASPSTVYYNHDLGVLSIWLRST